MYRYFVSNKWAIWEAFGKWKRDFMSKEFRLENCKKKFPENKREPNCLEQLKEKHYSQKIKTVHWTNIGINRKASRI